MAAIRSRGPLPVGSMEWINDENLQVERHCEQESEDFGFSARNELEWLNEHMADIFAKDQINVTEIFKTPGKLRGKTPHTTRKRDPLQTREPLADIFSTNAESKAHPIFNLQNRSPEKPVPTFTIAQDSVEVPAPRLQKKPNTDSGYHGLSEDDIDIDRVPQPGKTLATATSAPQSTWLLQTHTLDQSDDRSTTERSFHSAREEITKTQVIENAPHASEPPGASELCQTLSKVAQPEPMAIDGQNLGGHTEEESVVDDSRSPSQVSSPARPLVRKSSLTFAALPARPPMTTKKSLGTRTSRTSNLDQSNFLGRFTGGKSLGGTKQPDPSDERSVEPLSDKVLADKPSLVREESDTDAKMRRLHNKSTTQLLHEKIHLLGKSQTARPTKSIPAVASVTRSANSQPPDTETQLQKTPTVAAQQSHGEDDDDWIQAPHLISQPAVRPTLPKSVSTDVMEDIRGKQTISDKDFDVRKRERSASRVESPHPYVGKVVDLRTASDTRAASPGIYSAYDGVKTFDDAETVETLHGHRFGASTTPFGSPSSKRYVDGPLSASKSKLQSIMKTAKSLFSSSAGVSAQAKMNLLSPADQHDPESSNWEIIGGNGPPETQEQILSNRTEDTTIRKTRSSTEKEEQRRKNAGERQLAEQRHTKVHDSNIRKGSAKEDGTAVVKTDSVVQPLAKPTRTSPRKTQNQEAPEVPERTTSKKSPHQGAPGYPRHAEQSLQSAAPPTTQDHRQPSQMQRSKDPRRPIKPVKDAGPRTKPQPVEIRVGMPSTKRIPLTNTALSSGLQETLKSSVSGTTKPKALIAAERKKEQDEKEAQRKRDQKAEIDRRRAAQQEESRRQEQLHRDEAEKQRERERLAAAEDPKTVAQKQAIERRRKELQKKDQHQQRLAAKQPSSTTRPELGGARPPSRQQNGPDNLNKSVNNHPNLNPSKAPIKRVFDPENDDAPARPKPSNGPPYQQHEAKRRRTEDEEGEEFPMRLTHAPPIRQSGIVKDRPKPSIFTSSYAQAPAPAPHHTTGPSLLKSTTQNQAYQQQHAHPQQILRPGNHPDIKQFANSKIPFADVPNPPAPHQPQPPPHQQQPSTHKIPHQSKLPPPPSKPSPQYQNGENIHLDDIPTDSEDDSSPSSSPSSANPSKPKPTSLPEWAQSPQLRTLLMHQEEGLDPDAVFGPVQSPHMEEMFKERHHRFRSRTSSANWAGQDRLTEEEIRRDVDARQRLRREGGWSFGLAP